MIWAKAHWLLCIFFISPDKSGGQFNQGEIQSGGNLDGYYTINYISNQ